MRNLFLFLTLSFLTLSSHSQIFKEVSDEIGLNYQTPGADNQDIGSGVTIIDVNNDGWDDIFQSGGVFKSKLWLNNKGKFEDITSIYGLDTLDKYFVLGAVAGDLDNDGFEDLIICNKGETQRQGDSLPPLVLKNVNGTHFEPSKLFLTEVRANYPHGGLGDVNKDGYLDFLMIGWSKIIQYEIEVDAFKNPLPVSPVGYKNLFFLNHKGDSFINMTEQLGFGDTGCGLAVSFTDFDNDDDIDIIMLNDFGHLNNLGNRLYRNEFPELRFTEVSQATNFYAEFYGMGVGPGDVNQDGYIDYYLTNIGRNYFYSNNQGKFKEIAIESGVDMTFIQDDSTGTSWSALFFDADLDGDLDLIVIKGFLNSFLKVLKLDKNQFFENQGDFVFIDKSLEYGLNDSLANRGGAFIDFDHDGDLDIVSTVLKSPFGEFAGVDQKIKLYENQIKTKNRWLGITLKGKDGVNTSCLGCRATFTIDGKTYLREVETASGNSSQSTRTLYFGVGNNKKVENITINWIGGEKQVIKKLKTNRHYKITYGEKPIVTYK